MNPLGKIRALLLRRKLDAEMAAEMQLHVELQAERNRETGMNPDEALYAARRQFGNIGSIQEQVREARGWVWLEQVLQDLRFAVRGLRRTPGFTVVAVLTLALGIGVNTGVFSIIHGLLLRARVAHDPASYVHLAPEYSGIHDEPRMPGAISLADYQAYKNGSRALTDLAGWAIQRAKLDDDTKPELALLVTSNFFAVYGLERAKLGRLFRADECTAPGTDPVLILSEEIWRDRFGSDPKIIGRVVGLNRHPFTVVGVTPARFSGRLRGPGVWIPYSMQPALSDWRDNLFARPNSAWLMLDGRLKPGHSREEAQAELIVLAKTQDRLQPGRQTTMFLTNGSLAEEPSLRASVRWLPPLIMAAVSLVLLLTCVNVTMLLLARAAAREREMAVRLALGAGRRRLLRMLFTESLTLAIAAGTLSAYLTYQIPTIFEKLFVEAPNYPLEPDWFVFVYLSVATVLAAAIAGFSPAFKSARVSVVASLNGQESFFGTSPGRWRLRDFLVAGQVSMSVVLLVGAGMFVRAELAMLRADLGFDAKQVLSVPLNTSVGRYRDSAALFYRTIIERVRGLPQVEAACYASQSPGVGTEMALGEKLWLPGQPEETGRRVEVNSVSPDFFATFHMAIISGQTFRDADVSGDSTGSRAVVVSETFAGTFWPGEDALGKVVEAADGRALRVVAVVRDGKSSFGGAEGPRIYRMWNPQVSGYSLMIRFRGAALPLATAVKAAVAGLDAEMNVVPSTLRAQLDEVVGRFAVIVRLILMLGVIGLLLSVVGIYGVVSFMMNRRTKEMGIRVALGANRRDILRLVVRSALRPVGVGIVAGTIFAVFSAQAMKQELSHMPVTLEARDPAVYIFVALLLATAALVAVFRPALRASRVDPMAALRCE